MHRSGRSTITSVGFPGSGAVGVGVAVWVTQCPAIQVVLSGHGVGTATHCPFMHSGQRIIRPPSAQMQSQQSSVCWQAGVRVGVTVGVNVTVGVFVTVGV